MGILDWFKDYWKDIKKSTGKTFKNIVLTAHFWVLLISVALIVAMAIIIAGLLGDRKDQDMGKYWQNGGETSYRQLSVFAKAERDGENSPLFRGEGSDALTYESVQTMRKTLQGTVDSGKKKIAGDTNKEIDPQGWEDCYSTFLSGSVDYTKSMDVNGETKTKDLSVDAEIVAVGGNFRAFHPFEFLSGGFLPEDTELDKNLVVVNDNLAWVMFKSYDVCGQKIRFWGDEFTIVGVVKEKKSDVDQTTGADKNRLYCYFKTLSDYNGQGGFSGNADTAKELAINCYEVMLPEVVKGVARNDVLLALPSYNSTDPQQRIVSNTGRFFIKNIYDQNIPVGKFASDTEGYEFPYWEKASILTGERLFVAEAVMAFGIILFLLGIVLLALFVRRKRLEPVVQEPDEPDEDDNSVITKMT